jgi:hypothetical protein
MLWYVVLSSPYKQDYPWYAWAYMIAYFVTFFTFPGVMFLQYAQIGIYNNTQYKPLLKNGGYLNGEKTYQILSLSAKSMLLYMCMGAVFDASSSKWQYIGSDY